MRTTIHVDSATTDEVRRLARALHRAGLTATLAVGLNGPDHWTGTTPPLTPDQLTAVMEAGGL